jgi:hypothetical protein
MTRTVFAALLLAVPALAWADRISDMPRTERCVYKARLAVAGYYYYLQGRPRQEVRVHWRGDETRNEVDFIVRTLDEAYAHAAALRERGSQVSEQGFGDLVYEACMSGAQL